MTYDFLDPLSRPLIEAGVIVAAGLCLLVWRHYRTAIAFVLLGMAWAWVCSTPAFATWLQHGLISRYPRPPAASYPKAPVIVVLGGGTASGPGRFRPARAERTPTTRIGFGLKLYDAGRAPVLFLSGGGGGALMMARIAERQGVPAHAIQTETHSATTHQNAEFSAAILKRENQRHILLVTSALHMPRAAACFRRQGLEVIPAPVPAVTRIPRQPGDAWWPQRRARWVTGRCLHEYFGLWGYKLLGWA